MPFSKDSFSKRPNQNRVPLSTKMGLFCSTSTTVSKSSRKEGSVSVETSQKLCSFSRETHQKWRFPKETSQKSGSFSKETFQKNRAFFLKRFHTNRAQLQTRSAALPIPRVRNLQKQKSFSKLFFFKKKIGLLFKMRLVALTTAGE